MAKTKTSFNSERGRTAGKRGAKSLLKKYGRDYFRKLAKKSWKVRKSKISSL